MGRDPATGRSWSGSPAAKVALAASAGKAKSFDSPRDFRRDPPDVADLSAPTVMPSPQQQQQQTDQQATGQPAAESIVGVGTPATVNSVSWTGLGFQMSKPGTASVASLASAVASQDSKGKPHPGTPKVPAAAGSLPRSNQSDVDDSRKEGSVASSQAVKVSRFANLRKMNAVTAVPLLRSETFSLRIEFCCGEVQPKESVPDLSDEALGGRDFPQPAIVTVFLMCLTCHLI